MKLLMPVVNLLMVAGLCGCSHSGPPSSEDVQACKDAKKNLDAAEDEFITQVQQIRGEHILVVDYDRKMISTLTGYRDRVRAILDGDEAESAGHGRCTGQAHEDLRVEAGQKLNRVHKYLISFQKALHTDRPDTYLP